MSTAYAKHFSSKQTPQTQPIPGKNMIKNNAGGYGFSTGSMDFLDRFLILGTEGGTYYVSESKLTIDAAQSILEMIRSNGLGVVNRVIEISDAGRAPSNDPALFVLAMASKFGDTEVRKHALASLSKVARIGTHLFTFCEFREAFGGWGRLMKGAVADWYLQKDLEKLVYQVNKYQQRNGWSHRDLLRLSHPKTQDETRKAIFDYICHKDKEDFKKSKFLPDFFAIVEEAKNCKDPKRAVKLITDHNLTREMISTELLNHAVVWEALLQKMPLGALVRNLGNLSKAGVLVPLSNASKLVVSRLVDKEALHKARLHPISILNALYVYKSGKGIKGSGTWKTVPQVVDALDDAFYNAFQAIQPSNENYLLGIDVSSSMDWNTCGKLSLSCAVGAAAMAMVTARTEPNYYIHGFTGNFVDLGITASQSLAEVKRKVQRNNFGSTDCSLPMIYALKNKLHVDKFVVYTDNETWAGKMQPCQALEKYRQQINPSAKLLVVGMAANRISIADPEDGGMLDIVGFDTATPQVISKF